MRRSVAVPAGAELDEVLPLPYPEPCRGCGEEGETQLLLRIPRKLIGRRTPADKLKPWPICSACIPSLPARIRERLPKEDDVSDETPTPTETPTETQTSTQRASKAASRAARERAAETARVERGEERRCIIVRYRRPRGQEMARRRCTSVVSRAHLTGICGRCMEYLQYHQLDRTELPVVAVDEDGLVAGPGRYLLDEGVPLGKWGEYLEKPAEEDQRTPVDVVAEYDQVIIDALRGRVAELEGDVAERDALVARLEGEVEEQTQALLVAESDKAYLSSAFREAQASVERLVETAREREQGIAGELGELADALQMRDRRIEELEDQVEELEAKISRFNSVDVDRDARQRLERVERSLRVSLESAVSAGAWSSVASIATLLQLVER